MPLSNFFRQPDATPPRVCKCRCHGLRDGVSTVLPFPHALERAEPGSTLGRMCDAAVVACVEACPACGPRHVIGREIVTTHTYDRAARFALVSGRYERRVTFRAFDSGEGAEA